MLCLHDWNFDCVFFPCVCKMCSFWYRFGNSRFLPDPFVKVYLLQDGKKISKKKTSTKRDDTNPIFNEAMIFSVPSNVLQVRTFCTRTFFHISWYNSLSGGIVRV